MYSWVTFQHLLDWTEGKWVGPKNLTSKVTCISSDTRTFKKDEVFLALKGANFDGNEFLNEAVSRGASLLIAEKELNATVAQIIVPNALNAFIKIAENLRSKFAGPVVAITGSAGKSSTKDMLATLLGENTVSSPASFNNLLGVSKTLCLLDDKTQNLVLEVGMNNFFEIKEICERFKPDYGLITNIGDAHIGKLGGKEGIYRAKKELFDYFASMDTAVGIALNVDDVMVLRAYQESFKSNKIQTTSYTLNENTIADVKVLDAGMHPENGGLQFRLVFKGRTEIINVPIFGLHHAQNIAASVAMAMLQFMSFDALRERLSFIRPAKHRGEVWHLSNGALLIDESYNSNPTALLSSLSSLRSINKNRRRIFILGQMNELGDFSESLHRDCGSKFADFILKDKSNFILICVGSEMTPFVQSLRQKIPTFTCYTEVPSDSVLKDLVHPSDVVFVKGSRGNYLDKQVDFLKSL